MKKLIIGILLGFLLTLGINIFADITLTTPVNISYSNVKISQVTLNKNGTVTVQYINENINQTLPTISFTALTAVKNILNQIDTYVTNNNLIIGTTTPN